MAETDYGQQVWVRLPAPVIEKIDKMAVAERRSRANLLSILVIEAVDTRTQADQPASAQPAKKGGK